MSFSDVKAVTDNLALSKGLWKAAVTIWRHSAIWSGRLAMLYTGWHKLCALLQLPQG